MDMGSAPAPAIAGGVVRARLRVHPDVPLGEPRAAHGLRDERVDRWLPRCRARESEKGSCPHREKNRPTRRVELMSAPNATRSGHDGTILRFESLQRR